MVILKYLILQCLVDTFIFLDENNNCNYKKVYKYDSFIYSKTLLTYGACCVSRPQTYFTFKTSHTNELVQKDCTT